MMGSWGQWTFSPSQSWCPGDTVLPPSDRRVIWGQLWLLSLRLLGAMGTILAPLCLLVSSLSPRAPSVLMPSATVGLPSTVTGGQLLKASGGPGGDERGSGTEGRVCPPPEPCPPAVGRWPSVADLRHRQRHTPGTHSLPFFIIWGPHHPIPRIMWP